MYKVLIVDDEPWILTWLEKAFKWNEKGFEVIAKTDDPEKAYEYIFKDEPDVVFTDVRMPVISGLDLMRMTRERGMDTEFVVVSGFADFSYAQQAIREGAFDYRLKPIQMDEADELLDKLFAHLEKKRKSRNIDVLEALKAEQEDFGNILKDKGFSGGYKYYQAAMVIANPQPDIGSRLSAVESCEVLEFKLGPGKHLYLVSSQQDCTKTLLDMLEKFNDGNKINAGLSSVIKSGGDISRLIKEADLAACNYFIHDRGGVYLYKKGNLNLLKSILENIFTALDMGSDTMLKTHLDKVHGIFAGNEMGMDEVVYFWNQIVAHATGIYKKKTLSLDLEFMNYHQLVDKFGTFASLVEYLQRFMSHIISNGENGSDIKDYGDNFNALLEYVNRNYSQKLYLKDLASKFYINFTYCCELFKKTTGSTFSEYITGLRMKKARELLEQGRLTTDRICEETGYTDYYYFNSLFKKYHGVTPSQYRKGLR